ncbi:MAG: response regulator transcription factor [Lachnospiraceae bacterium]|nr:response regulator transcription factor [Lachnospiraceae bacterium]
MMKTILIIEDDQNISDMLKKLLGNNGYNTRQAFSGTEGLLVHDETVDLILMDLMLPGKNGEEIIKDLKEKNNVPVIVMSAISDVDKKVDLFSLGAIDYVTKPFHNDELLARIKVHLKGKDENTAVMLSYKDIEINTKDFTVLCNHKELILTKNEFELLKALMERPAQVFTRSMLFDLVWGDEDSADDNTLNVHISKIRNKLKQCNPSEEYIETVWSIGYRMSK